MDEPEGALSDYDVGDEEGWDEDDESEVVPCPSCGAELFEDAEQCPHCGDFITAETSPWKGKPVWWIILGLAGIAAVIWLAMPAI